MTLQKNFYTCAFGYDIPIHIQLTNPHFWHRYTL